MAVKAYLSTGARSEYGISKGLCEALDNDDRFEFKIVVHGMHLLKKFGYTIDEIIKDGFDVKAIDTYNEENINEKVYDLLSSVEKLYKYFKKEQIDVIIVLGDRIEAYATALAAHFLKIPIAHVGGGVITEGAIDNIYRYNISNIATWHFVTTNRALERIKKLPIIDEEKIFNVGSLAIEKIFDFKKEKTLINDVFININKKYVLMTFHPVTNSKEDIVSIMRESIEYILSKDLQIIITYPNNDDGFEKIIETIEQYHSNENIFISKSLGARNYYIACKYCEFVIGNSSSGVIEVPYFNKRVINIGSRQDGRDMDNLVKCVPAEYREVKEEIDIILNTSNFKFECDYIFGYGNTSNLIIENLVKGLF